VRAPITSILSVFEMTHQFSFDCKISYRMQLPFSWENFRKLENQENDETMDYVKLGKTGLKVSRICLGCMTYGSPEKGTHAWALNEEQSRPFIQKALELGINFFDTANVYSGGASEEVLGRALADFAKRDEVVVATKVYGAMRKDPNGRGLARKAILTEIDASLRRLGTDYVDLYQIHRWDYDTPIEETLEVLHDVVKAGKARYIGASSMFAWQFCKSLYLADLHGSTRFVSMQPHYNLLYREEEREMLGLCQAESVGVLPWSPLARGRLTRPWESQPSTERARTDEYGKGLYGATQEADKEVVYRVGQLSEARDLPRAQIALAWLLHQPVVTAPIVGGTKPHHLEDAVGALSVKLSDEEIKSLEEPYIPHPVVGFE
jgi:1-deoxyxylulose-5-phosphate synthase